MIRAIVAMDEKRGIARSTSDGSTIPWDLSIDRAYFKQQTQGAIVLMGCATYQLFTEPLPNRRNIVVSKTLSSVRPGFELLSNVSQFLTSANQDVWIIGGAGLYESTLDYCEELYITHVTGDFGCDRFFPEFESVFEQVSADFRTENGYEFSFAIYQKTGEPLRLTG